MGRKKELPPEWKVCYDLYMNKVAYLSLFFAATAAFALPNVVGGFFNVAGMRFEDFANQAKIWKVDAELAGDWKQWSDDSLSSSDNVEVLRLKQRASVFGIPANSVDLYRKDSVIKQFKVDFADDPKTTIALKANIGAWADGEWDTSGRVIQSSKVALKILEGNLVQFSPASP